MCDLLLAESIQGLKYRFDNFVMQIHYLRITLISEMCNFFAVYQLSIHTARLLKVGREHSWNGAQDLCFEESHVSSQKIQFSENE